MKTNRFTKTLIGIFSLFVLIGCEENLSEIVVEEQQIAEGVKLFRGDMQDFPELGELFQKTVTEKKALASKGYNDELYDFVVDQSSVSMITYEDDVYYSFAILRSNTESGAFENLTISNNAGAEPLAYIISYFPDDAYWEGVRENPNTLFSGQRSIVPLDTERLAFSRQGSSCFTVTTTYCNFDGHVDNDLGDGVAGPACTDTYTVTSTVCLDVGDSDGGGLTGNEGTPNGGGTGSGSSSGGTDDQDSDPLSLTDSTIITTPNVPYTSILKDKMGYSFLSQQARWIDKQENWPLVEEMVNFSKLNQDSSEALNEVDMTVSLHTAVDNNGFTSRSGKIANNDALEYTHVDFNFDGGQGTLYRLKSGLFMAEYPTKRGINGGTIHDQDLSLSFNGNFYYAYNPDQENDFGVMNGYSLGWYEVIIPPILIGDGFENAFLDALWNGAEFLGRYVLPIEDIVIMIDGRDFDGVEQSRVQAAGFFIVGLIPGGKVTKAFKPVAKIVKGTKAWATIIKWGDKTHKLSFKLTNGIIDFGDRAQLGRILGTTSGIEAHHIIPWTRGGAHDVVQEAAHAGFHLNMVQNGLGLKKFTKLIGEGLHGNHPAYDSFVVHRLDNFAQNSYDSESASKYLFDTLIPELKNWIVKADNSGMNLNDYFKNVVNPSEGVPGF